LAPPGDDAKFLNHSDDPNTHERRLSSIAARPIFAGDEITCDYGALCVDWPGLAPSDDSQTGTRKLPHEGLYARLQPSDQGVGVFAIRDIPKGTALFESHEGATPRVDVALVDELADDEPCITISVRSSAALSSLPRISINSRWVGARRALHGDAARRK
jgi:hypothetical protein